jgi:Skp family chaperone for outer membrane proteins
MHPDEPQPRDVAAPSTAPPVTETAQVGPPTPWYPSEPTAPPRRRGSRAATVVLAVVLVVTLVGAGLVLMRMLSTNQAWQDSTQQWETLARTTGEELGASQADLAATQAELDATTAQLVTAQERITQLADEKAQLGDTSASQQQLADYQARVSQAAGQVATALASCVDGQQRLIGYLQNATQYDPDDLGRFTSDVQTVCARATDANAALQRELDR